LVFYIADPDWDGSYDPPIAIIRFDACAGAILGPPNDEALNGHRLWGKGLEFYGTFVVRNSLWIREVRRIGSVHPRHDPGRKTDLSHYVICFHDTTFECLARGFEVHTTAKPLGEALLELTDTLVGRRSSLLDPRTFLPR
jgi:hypothetical protein